MGRSRRIRVVEMDTGGGEPELCRLADALGTFSGLEIAGTRQELGSGTLWVWFRFGAFWEHPWRDLAELTLGFLGPELWRAAPGLASVSLVPTPNGLPQAEFSTSAEALPHVEAALRRIAVSWNARLAAASDRSAPRRR